MYLVISPAKKLLAFNKPYTGATSTPALLDGFHQLLEIMKIKSVEDIASLMDLSNDLATLNYTRYQQYHFTEDTPASYPAVLLFQGDVYQGLQASSFTERDLNFAQSHMGILSGLYGLLSPLDKIQPYRLEMGTKLKNPAGKNLYDFWKGIVALRLNEILSTHANPILINLASSEYFKVIDGQQFKYPIVTINFYEKKSIAGKMTLKMVGIHAKKARGVMAQYIIKNQIDKTDMIKEFSELGYQFSNESSSDTQFNFVRG